MRKVGVAEVATALHNSAESIPLLVTRTLTPLSFPGRPDKPRQVEPREMLNHKQLGIPLNVYLVHALAHIELNAVDLYWDLILRSCLVNVSRPLKHCEYKV